ncbi:hypothetical protein L842_3076 [Mycobacterium intracellulare MIN_052511_1280]|nr:hypothetical protein L842_3076 [Mycobacterium intracellulare MIN_052511_1280]
MTPSNPNHHRQTTSPASPGDQTWWGITKFVHTTRSHTYTA